VNKSHRDPFQCGKDAAKSNAAENTDTNENELKKKLQFTILGSFYMFIAAFEFDLRLLLSFGKIKLNKSYEKNLCT
jgi:hypothetical protein